MKKLLSVVLALTMLFTMVLPMSVFAEDEVVGDEVVEETPSAISITNTEATTIEVDEYVVEGNAAGFAASANTNANNGFMLSGAKSSIYEGVTVSSVNVTVANTGYYDLEYVATNYAAMGSNAQYYSKVNFYLTPVVEEGEEATAVKIAGTDKQNVVEEYTFSSAGIPYAKFCDIRYIEAGEYTLTTFVTVAGANVRGGVDYIKFSKANENISYTAVKTFEVERYASTGTVTTYAGDASDDRAVVVEVNGTEELTIASVPVTVDKTGFYDLEYVASDYARSTSVANFSRINFYLAPVAEDGTVGTKVKVAATDKQNVIDTLEGKFTAYTTLPVSKFCDRALLTAGQHILSVGVYFNGGVRRGLADYIKFSASAPEELSSSQATTIELSDYSTKSGVVKPDGENTVIYTTWSSSRTEAYVWLDVEKSGYYDLEYISNAPKAGSYGAAKFSIDGTTIASASSDTGVDAEGYTLWTATAVKKYTKARVYVEAGLRTLKFEFTPDGGTNYRGLADYIKFTPTAAEETIAADGETTIEFAEYASYGSTDFEGNTIVYTSGSANKPVIKAIVDVEASGYYDVEYVVSNNKDSTNYLSPVTITLGETVLGKSNRIGGTELGAYKFSSAPMTKYTNLVYLEAGSKYILDLDVAKTTADNLYKFQADYIKFAPAASVATITADEAETIEFSDLVGTSAQKVANTETGNKVVFIQDASFKTIKTMITVEDAGKYDIEYVAQSYNSNFSSPIFKLDGVEIANGITDEGVSVDTEYPGLAGWAGDSYTDAYKFTKTEVELAAGTYVLTVEFPYAGGLYRGYVDYITFTPSEEEVILPNEATTIAWAEGTNDVVVTSAYVGSAKVIWVSYDANGKMVSWKTSEELTLTNVGSLPVSVPAGFEASARKKAMLWTNTTNCKPLAAFID